MESSRMIGKEFRAINNLLRRTRDGSEIHSYVENMTGMHGWVIGYLCHHQDEEIYQKDLEAQFMLRRSTATGILQLMERNGLIVREPVPRDKRLKKVVLTEKALEVHQLIHQDIMATEERMKNGIAPKDLETFFKVMDQIRDNLEQ